jgi:hypothetical protein
VLALLAPASAAAATYYVDPAGSDAGAGTTPATAWKTLGKVSGTTLQPGDQVLLKAGVRHGNMLQLRGSGTAAAPIVVSTYGTGRALLDPRGGGSGYAGIVLSDNAYVRFEHLEVAGWGAGNPAISLGKDASNVTFEDLWVHDVDTGFLATAGSTPHDIAIRNSTIDGLLQGRGSIGINLTKGAYRWTVTGTRVANAGDSCIIDLGHDNTYDGLTITDCGHWIVQQYGGHGAYLRGPNLTIRNSDVSNAPTNCVSIRFQNAVVEGNTLHGCAVGIGYFEYATANDSNVRLLRNRIWDTKTAVYVDFKSKQRFLLANNTIQADREGIVVRSGTALAIENTIVTGSASTLVAYEGIPAGGYTERNNVLATTAGGSALSWPGGSGDLAAYRSATGQGTGTTNVAPVWAAGAPEFVPAPGTQPVDSGTASPATGALTPGCDGRADHYCGAAPERGARELDPSGKALPTNGAAPAPPRATPPRSTTRRASRRSRRASRPCRKRPRP